MPGDEAPDGWVMHFDGAFARQGAGAGVRAGHSVYMVNTVRFVRFLIISVLKKWKPKQSHKINKPNHINHNISVRFLRLTEKPKYMHCQYKCNDS